VPQDRLFQAAQLGGGFDGELVHEPLPAVAVARECVGLAAAR
jgi:hypothetical protein